MIRTTTLLLTASLSLIMSLSAQAASPPTPITFSRTITAPGNYVLANDINAGNGIGIGIQSSDVTLNLNGHTVTASQGTAILIYGNDNGGLPIVNARVSNGRVVGSYGVTIYGSDCLITGLNITVVQTGSGISINSGRFNRVHNCVLTGQQAETAFGLFLSSQNTIQNCTLAGSFIDTIEEQDEVNGASTVVGDNTFSGNQFASPTQ